MLDIFYEIIQENIIAFGAVNFLLGILLGHWLNIGRDRRKEFNDAAIPIRQALVRQLDCIKGNRFIPEIPDRDELIGFQVFLHRTSIRGYCQAVDNYCQCFKHETYLVPHNKNGIKTFSKIEDLKSLEKATRMLLKYFTIK